MDFYMSSGECWIPALTGRPEGEEAEVQGEIRGVGVFVELGDSRRQSFFVSNPETWAAHAPLKVVVSCYVYRNMIYDKPFLIHDK